MKNRLIFYAYDMLKKLVEIMSQGFSNLTGKILIASPFTMENNVFHQSLIYVIKHTDEGSIGLIFNQPVHKSSTSNVFKKINMANIDDLTLTIHLGGPSEIEKGFFLHTSDYNKNILFKPDDNDLSISSNTQILQDIKNGEGPRNSLFIVGYTGWEAGQIESELEHNLWIISEPDNDLIFSKDSPKKWHDALRKLGISAGDFVTPSLTIC